MAGDQLSFALGVDADYDLGVAYESAPAWEDVPLFGLDLS